MRNFNYLRDANETQELLRIIREYQKTIENYDLKIFTVIEQQKVTEFKEKVASFLKEFDLPWPNDIGNKINEELLSPEVVNNLKPPTYEYSHDASITGCKVEALSNELFRLEEEIAHYVARIWKETLTSFDNFQKEVKNFFPNISNVTGQGQYKDKTLQGLHITITTQFYSETEITSFTQYVAQAAKSYLPSGIPVDIKINGSDGETQSFVSTTGGNGGYYTHVFGSY